MITYLTKCTIVVHRNGTVVWKINLSALSQERAMDSFESHPALGEKNNNNRDFTISYCLPDRSNSSFQLNQEHKQTNDEVFSRLDFYTC